jgi:uncharacterized protein (TIGR03435 family)
MLVLWAGVALGQTTFEAASIRPSDPAKAESFWRASPGRVAVQNMSLKSLVMAFYKVKEYQVVGGPGWVDADRFDIAAKMPAGAPATAAALMEAARALLAERFGLVLHEESRPMAGYALVVAKGGFKVKPASGDGSSNVRTGKTTLEAVGLTMERLASSLATIVDAPVEDATGIAGTYDFTFEWTLEDGVGPALSALGLKLEGRKVPSTVLSIERAVRPEAN